ncbi:MAG: tetratricopeptide repeat protein [Thermoanaerobaculales bacterium]|nr:tetratricopeptide repeat protein [Thermoanaerobaculales bacterium]
MNSKGYRSLLAIAVLITGACASTSSAPPMRFGEETWKMVLEAKGIEPGGAVYPFTATPEMVEWAKTVTRHEVEPLDQLTMLHRALFEPKTFPFSYDETRTLTADQAFVQRRGNCLSFTALFITLARSIDLPAFLVTVYRPPSIEQREDVVVVNRHVVAGYSKASRLYLYDFYHAREVPNSRRVVVDDLSASALFHTNYGGEAIRRGDLAAAQHHFEVATTLAPHLAAPWIGLGVTHSRVGNPEAGFAAYGRALDADPGNPSALTNIAYLHQQSGREEEATAALRAAAQGRSSPFSLIALADAEAAQGNMDDAEHYLRRARRTYRNEPAVYEAQARFAKRRGDPKQAQRYLEKADKLRSRREP